MFEQAFKNIDDVLWKEAGCTTELDYTEQTSWLLFLKYLDGLELDRADEAALEGKTYTYILDKPYRWEDQSTERRRPRRVRRTAKDLRRLAQELECGRQNHRPDHLRSLREEPERWRGSHLPQPAGNHGRDCRTGFRERGGAGEDQGAIVKLTNWQLHQKASQ